MIYMGPGASVLETTVKLGSRNASQESILRESNAQKNGLPIQNFGHGVGIKRTDEICVTSYQRDGGSLV